MSDITIRPASAQDAARLAQIYAYYVSHTAVSFEYDPPGEEEFARRIAHTMARYPYLVAERDGTVLGYAYAEALRERPAYDRSAELTIYLDPAMRRRGAGRMLYTAMEQLLPKQGVTNLYTCVAVTDRADDPYLNADSPRFHERMGYAECGRFHACGEKFGLVYDVIWMEKIIG